MSGHSKFARDKIFVVFVFLLFTILFSAGLVQASTDLNQQIDYLAKKLASSNKGEVLKSTEEEVYISLGLDQGILPGNRFEIIRQGGALKIGDEVIGYEETKLAIVEVSKVRDKMSIGSYVEKTQQPEAGDKAYQVRKRINRLVVGQFSYNQSFNRLTKSLQEKLFTAMSNRGMQVVERDQLEKVLKEQKLGYSGLVNMSSAKKIGELLGAEGIMLGTVSDMGNSITINARLVDMESGNTITASEVELPKTPLIAQLLDIPVEDKPYTPQDQVATGKSANPANRKQVVQESNGFSFTLQKCENSGGQVKCTLLITNNSNDRSLALYATYQYHGSSRMFDFNGNSYKSSSISFSQCSDTRGCTVSLIKGIPAKAEFEFSDVGQDVKKSAVIEIVGESDNKRIVQQFRDIQFE